MLRIDNLHVSVGGSEILRGLTLAVPAGEVHAVMGRTGPASRRFPSRSLAAKIMM